LNGVCVEKAAFYLWHIPTATLVLLAIKCNSYQRDLNLDASCTVDRLPIIAHKLRQSQIDDAKKNQFQNNHTFATHDLRYNNLQWFEFKNNPGAIQKCCTNCNKLKCC
jgi:hypothetical protein